MSGIGRVSELKPNMNSNCLTDLLDVNETAVETTN
jgi:hypothetical protein